MIMNQLNRYYINKIIFIKIVNLYINIKHIFQMKDVKYVSIKVNKSLLYLIVIIVSVKNASNNYQLKIIILYVQFVDNLINFNKMKIMTNIMKNIKKKLVLMMMVGSDFIII